LQAAVAGADQYLWRRPLRFGLKVPLLADGVGFGEPCFKFAVNVGYGGESEMVDVVSDGNGVDAAEARVLESAGENDVAIYPLQARSHLREGHAHLKGDAGLFGQDDDGAATLHGGEHGVEDCADGGGLAFEMGLQIVLAAEVGLIAVGEFPLAPRALPKRALWMLDHNSSRYFANSRIMG
jgi:hypothetical protein